MGLHAVGCCMACDEQHVACMLKGVNIWYGITKKRGWSTDRRNMRWCVEVVACFGRGWSENNKLLSRLCFENSRFSDPVCRLKEMLYCVYCDHENLLWPTIPVSRKRAMHKLKALKAVLRPSCLHIITKPKCVCVSMIRRHMKWAPLFLQFT